MQSDLECLSNLGCRLGPVIPHSLMMVAFDLINIDGQTGIDWTGNVHFLFGQERKTSFLIIYLINDKCQ